MIGSPRKLDVHDTIVEYNPKIVSLGLFAKLNRNSYRYHAGLSVFHRGDPVKLTWNERKRARLPLFAYKDRLSLMAFADQP